MQFVKYLKSFYKAKLDINEVPYLRFSYKLSKIWNFWFSTFKIYLI